MSKDCVSGSMCGGELYLSEHDLKLLEQGSGCIDVARLDTIYSFYSLLSATPRRKRASLYENEDMLRSLWDNNSEILVRYKGSRIFKTVEDVVEYFALGNGELNGGDINIYFTEVPIIECESENSAFVTADSKVVSSFDGDKVSTSRDRFVFGGSSSLIAQVDTNVPTSVNNILLASSYDRQWFCDTATLRCPGELYPYDNLEDCYNTTAYIPDICTAGVKDDYTDGVLQGDTIGCRYLHLLSAGLRPVHHCPHLRSVSEVCRQVECPSAVRLSDPLEVNKEFDAGHAMWIRTVELVVLAFVALLGVLSYMWYFINRRRFQRDITAPQKPAHLSSSNKLTNELPLLAFKGMTISMKNVDDTVVLHFNEGFLGGCRMTCITGESGSGKTSFFKLLCGFQLDHMHLKCEKWLRRDPVALCPQAADMWPKEMTVKDALFFSTSLAGVNVHDFRDCFLDLGLEDLMEQEIGTLSGGQLQRVNIAAAVVRPEPAVVFLDEPLAALDEDNSLACLQAIKDLPVAHAFVMTVHNASPKIAAMFDRAIHLDARIQTMVERKSLDPVFRLEDAVRIPSSQDQVSWSLSGTIRASLILWYGQFYGFPLLECLLLAGSAMGALVVGFLARKSTADWESSFLPAGEGTRVPFYIADTLVGMAFITSFGGALIFANREISLMRHFTTVRLMNPCAYIMTSLLFRSAIHGIIQASCWVFIAMPVLGYTSDLDILFINTAIFGFAWSGATFGASISNPSSLYSAHVIMIMDVLLTFFSGVFFLMSRLYGFFKVLHYFNPLFYILSANAYILAYTMDNGCGAKQHPGECASGHRIMELDEITQFTSLFAQGVNGLFVMCAFLLTAFALRTRDTVGSNNTIDVKDTGNLEDGELPEPLVAADTIQPSFSSSSMRQSLINAVSLNIRSSAKLNADDIAKQRVEWVDLGIKNATRKSLPLVVEDEGGIEVHWDDVGSDNENKISFERSVAYDSGRDELEHHEEIIDEVSSNGAGLESLLSEEGRGREEFNA